MKIVEDLYYGRISPYEMSISATPEYQKLKALADRNEGVLRETLSDEQKILLEKLTVCMTDISSISERDMFIAGFRLGMKMMICDEGRITAPDAHVSTLSLLRFFDVKMLKYIGIKLLSMMSQIFLNSVNTRFVKNITVQCLHSLKIF